MNSNFELYIYYSEGVLIMGDYNNPEDNNFNQNNQQQNNPEQNQYQQPVYQQPQQNQYQTDSNQYQYSYQYDASTQYDQPKKSSGLAIASLVCGIVGLVLCCCYYLSLPLSIVGLILGIVSLSKKSGGKGMAIVGVILSGITVVLAILMIAGVAALLGSEDFLNEIYREMGLDSYY